LGWPASGIAGWREGPSAAIVILDAVGEIDQVDDRRVAYIDAMMAGIYRDVDRRAIRRDMHIGDQRAARGRLHGCRNRPLREKDGGRASEEKSGGDAESRH
jgi:hypothetical protein